MARRKEVFQSKVFQRLYPVTPSVEKEPSPSHMVDTLAKKTCVKRKAPKEDPAIGDATTTQSAVNPGRRMYTVLPPPADYKADSEKSVTPPLLENINSAEDPAGESVRDSDEEEEEQGQSRKRRRRKKKKNLCQDSGKDAAAAVGESDAGRSQTAAGEGGERMSRNKKRKLKKKRHKEKLLSMGLVPRAAALEFTYKKDGEREKGKEEEEDEEEEEEEDNERRAADVSNFLRTTMEIYMSDSLMRVDKRLALSGTLDDLLSAIDGGRKPGSVLKQLHGLMAFVRRGKTDDLEKALEELRITPTMSPGISKRNKEKIPSQAIGDGYVKSIVDTQKEEATAVVSLFRYWITDVLPARGDATTGATHLRDSHSPKGLD